MYYQSEWDGMYDLIIVVRNQSKTSKVIFLVNISYFVLRKYVYTHMKITLFTYRQSVKINMKFSKTQVQYTLHV